MFHPPRNNGRAYTVYFYAETDKPFVNTATWKGDKITNEKFQYDSHQKTGALLRFNSSEEVVQLKVGISFLSSLKARQNAHSDIPHWSFKTAHQQLLTLWEDLLQRIEISPRTPEAQKRMFYTGLYHTMIMPVDRSGRILSGQIMSPIMMTSMPSGTLIALLHHLLP